MSTASACPIYSPGLGRHFCVLCDICQEGRRLGSSQSGVTTRYIPWTSLFVELYDRYDKSRFAFWLTSRVLEIDDTLQGLCRLNLGIGSSDAELLAEKFGHPEHSDLVNYACFSKIVNPTVPV